jgi:catechol 2,3-dioxygenase-like lactoylglutathione lyase family enzyme
MIKRGIDRICVSVSDIDESLAFFRDYVGMTVCADQTLAPQNIQKFWDLPEGTSARSVSLQKDFQQSILELIEFQPNSGKNIRDNATIFDYGIYDIAFIVRDLDKTYEDLIAKGYKFIAPPKKYALSWFPFEVKEAILIGPGKIPIAHLEKINSPGGKINEDYGLIADSAQVVNNIEETLRFYRDILGLELIADEKLPRGLVDEVLALPSGTDLRMAFLNKQGSQNPVIEFLEFSTKGKTLTSTANPLNFGLFMISFEVTDLSGLIIKLQDEKIKFLSKPMKMEIPCYGKVRSLLIETPNKAMIELFERQNDDKSAKQMS